MINLAALSTPGVYIDEVPKLPPSVAQVETAIPAFIGYTRLTELNGESLLNRPVKVKSLVEYEQVFGARIEKITAQATSGASGTTVSVTDPASWFRMYYALQLYFANGGGPCYIVSIGADEGSTISDTAHIAGLQAIAKEDEPTLLVLPDAEGIQDNAKFYAVYQQALAQCQQLQDRFLICDVYEGNKDFNAPGGTDVIGDPTNGFRTRIGTDALRYGAAYYPHLETTLTYNYDEYEVQVSGSAVPANAVLRVPDSASNAEKAKSLYHSFNDLYHRIREAIGNLPVILPPSGAIAGVYAAVDAARGVWKSPANVSLSYVKRPVVDIDDRDQESLNVDTTGKSINAIRRFTGKGTLVWGARTLDGNSNEWRYVSVRRFFNMVEESTKKATEPFVFEPNDANTWVKVRAMIENFLTLQWRAGALAGAKPEHAFYVRVGLGQTMTAQDILEGRMIVEIGMAVVRPAEFIILRFSHKMQES
ncbi:MAG: phage tail sheath C-terminal domain-containing protein [Solitalea sp.]